MSGLHNVTDQSTGISADPPDAAGREHRCETTDELIGGSFGWVRLVALDVLDRRRDISRETVEVGFAGRMMNDSPLTGLRTPFFSRTHPDSAQKTRNEIPYRA